MGMYQRICFALIHVTMMNGSCITLSFEAIITPVLILLSDISTPTPPVTQTPTSPDISAPTPSVTRTPTSPPQPVVSLTAPGPAQVGSEVTLNCSSDVVGSFVWSHSSISDLSSAASVAISQDASGVFSVLTISSVLISHAGTYSCIVSAVRQSSTKSSHLRVKCEFSFLIS